MSIPLNPELRREALRNVEAVVARCNFEQPAQPVGLYDMPKDKRETYIAEHQDLYRLV